jgi:hypothetical protein
MLMFYLFLSAKIPLHIPSRHDAIVYLVLIVLMIPPGLFFVDKFMNASLISHAGRRNWQGRSKEKSYRFSSRIAVVEAMGVLYVVKK